MIKVVVLGILKNVVALDETVDSLLYLGELQ